MPSMRAAPEKAVLTFGYGQATVHGAGSVRVLNIGSAYAYERSGSGYDRLQSAVLQSTGRPIDTFQGKYGA